MKNKSIKVKASEEYSEEEYSERLKRKGEISFEPRFRRYKPEWEKQRATWLSWPHNEKEWGKSRLPKIRKFYEKLISTILNFQDVNLIFTSEKLLNEIETRLIASQQKKKHKLKKIIIPNNDIWIRDYGPFSLETVDEKTKKKKPILLDFEFNSWGGKFPPWNLDNDVPKAMALYLGQGIESYPIILEGGALEFSGDGLTLTTEQCLLNKNRNPKLKKSDIENILRTAFGTEEIIWLKRGLEGDHTDGHIDDVARFVSPRKILICKSNAKKDRNYDHLNESIEYLRKWKHPKKGYRLDIIELPMPDQMEIKNEKLPNSYANFIFVNRGVIVPTFNCKSDKIALEIFKKIFPDRKIVGVDCSLLIQEGGGLHCMTKQEPLI